MRQPRVLHEVDQAPHRVIGVDGVLDAVASYDLRSLLTTLFATGHQHLQLDLSQVTYADQDGIGGLA